MPDLPYSGRMGTWLKNRKSYALYRMRLAIERSAGASSAAAQQKSQRWAVAWGMLAGIRVPGARPRLRRINLHGATR
jgi:hypothetical protein